MKKFLVFPVLLISIFLAGQVEKAIPQRPNPPRLVNDFTGTLTPEQAQALESKVVAWDDSTSNQLAIVLVNSLSDYDPDEYALALGRQWGVGGKEHSNGIVLLVAKADHKISIQVGYGLEGAIPDVTAKSIIDNDLTPNFRSGDFYRGLDQASDHLIAAAAGEYKAPKGYHQKGSPIPFGLIIFLIVLFVVFLSRGGRGGGGMVSRRGWGGFGTGWILGNMMGGGWSRGGGGGGGWSGGGGGGGGFGGFGGGSFGGGGASGGW
ncbi:MAG TPA: TPM domain-containing protein [Chitinophagaceae bacterium]